MLSNIVTPCKIFFFVISREVILRWLSCHGDSTNLDLLSDNFNNLTVTKLNKSSTYSLNRVRLCPSPLERECWQSLQLPQTTKTKSSVSIRHINVEANCQGQSCIKGSYQNCNLEHTKSLNNFLTYVRKKRPETPAEDNTMVKDHNSRCGKNSYCQKDDRNFSCCDLSLEKPSCADASRCKDTLENYKSNWELNGMDLRIHRSLRYTAVELLPFMRGNLDDQGIDVLV